MPRSETGPVLSDRRGAARVAQVASVASSSASDTRHGSSFSRAVFVLSFPSVVGSCVARYVHYRGFLVGPQFPSSTVSSMPPGPGQVEHVSSPSLPSEVRSSVASKLGSRCDWPECYRVYHLGFLYNCMSLVFSLAVLWAFRLFPGVFGVFFGVWIKSVCVCVCECVCVLKSRLSSLR